MHEDDQSLVHLAINRDARDHTSADANPGSTRGRSTTESLSLPPQNSGPCTRSQARGQNRRSTSNRRTGIAPTCFDLVKHSVPFFETNDSQD